MTGKVYVSFYLVSFSNYHCERSMTVGAIDLFKVVIEFYTKLRECIRKRPDDLRFITSDFPKMQCQWASYLLAIHIFNTTRIKTLELVCGFIEDWQGEEEISHYWLEYDGKVIDVTAGQYNLIEDDYLANSIVSFRPFLDVYCTDMSTAPHYILFTEKERIILNESFEVFTIEGLREWEEEYLLIMSAGV